MTRLLTIVGLLAVLTFIVTSCGPPYQQQPVVVQTQPVSTQGYQVIQDPNTGIQQVVYVDNSGAQQMMEYALFMQLWNAGSWNGVYRYTYSHPTVIHVYDNSRYSSWRSTRSYGNYNRATYSPPSGLRSTSNQNTSTFRNTSPASGLRSTNNTNTSTFRNTSPSSFRTTTSSSSFRSSTPASRPSGGFRSTSGSRRH